jgi:adenylate cyclase
MILLRTLGPLDLRSADGSEIRSVLVQPKRLALLLYLALASPRGFHRRERLMALFWPELDTARASNALSQALHVLRRGLVEDALINRGKEEVGLVEGQLRCDAIDFAEAYAARQWAASLELYRGAFLEGFFVADASPELEAWIEDERARLAKMALDAALTLALENRRRGDLSLAAHWIGWAGTQAPYDEAVLHARMSILAQQGDRAGALHAYDLFVRRSREELGMEPSAALNALAGELRSSGGEIGNLISGAPSADVGSVVPTVRERAGRARQGAHGRWTVPALVATLLLVVGSTLASSLMRGTVVPHTPPERSIAVLPFIDMSPQKDREFFSDGIAEDLLSALSQVEGLHVVGRASSFSFKGKNLPADSIGRLLGANYLLEGSVRASGERLRINAHLIDARNGYQIWSESYDRETKDVITVQSQIASAIAQVLRVKLAAPSTATVDPVAYDLYLRGLYLFNRRTNAAAAKLLEQAIAREPRFARAYATLSMAYRSMPNEDPAFDMKTYMGKSRDAADRALRIDPRLPDAHAALGMLLYAHQWEFAAGEAEVRHAIALNPSSALAHEYLAQMLERSGRTDEAMESIRHAKELDPARPQTTCMQAYLNLHSRRYTEALRLHEVALQEYDFPCREAAIEAYYSLGRYREAMEAATFHYQRFRTPEHAALLNRMAEDVLGAKIRGDAPRSDLVHAVEQSGIPFEKFVLAKWYTWAGDNDAAIRILASMVAEHHPSAFWLSFPHFDPLRSDPRYHALEATIGMPRHND